MTRTVMAYAMLALMAVGVAGNWLRRQWRSDALCAPLVVGGTTTAPIRPACACGASCGRKGLVPSTTGLSTRNGGGGVNAHWFAPNTESIWHGELPERVESFDAATRLASYGRVEVERDWPHVFSRE